MNENFYCVDSFSGGGGLSLGLQKAGFQILFSFDNDYKCVGTQLLNKKYFNHKIFHEGVDYFLENSIIEKFGLRRGQLFLLAGGPPCQGFSIQRIGKDADIRNELVIKFMNLVENFYPFFFLMENVPGIRGKRGKIILDAAYEKALKMGYQVYQKILDAQDYGVPQRRRRMFMIGIRNDVNKYKFDFPKIITDATKRKTVRDAIGNLPPPPLNGNDHPNFPNHRRDNLSPLNKKRLSALKQGQGREHLPNHLLANCHKLSASKIGHRNVYGRMNWNLPAPTITARFDSFTRGLFGHPDQLRSISLREGAILQTFPTDYKFMGNKVDVARQIGNAVPPKLAEILGKHIINYYVKILKSKNK